MWKALSLALGITLIVLGAELFFVDELEIRKVRGGANDSQEAANAGPFQSASFTNNTNPQSKAKTVLYKPADWMPWSFLAGGTIIVIYTFTLTSRTESS